MAGRLCHQATFIDVKRVPMMARSKSWPVLQPPKEDVDLEDFVSVSSAIWDSSWIRLSYCYKSVGLLPKPQGASLLGGRTGIETGFPSVTGERSIGFGSQLHQHMIHAKRELGTQIQRYYATAPSQLHLQARTSKPATA